MTRPDTDHSNSPSLTDSAVGAVVALVRVVELYDPAVAHRAALRAIVTDRMLRIADQYPSQQISEAVAAAALADIDLAVSRPADPESSNEPTRPLLGATIVGRLPGLRSVSHAVGERRARWDSSPDDLSVAARAVAVVDALVGNPAAGFVPTWEHALRRVRRSRGGALDPALCDVLFRCELDDIEAPPIPSAVVLDLLEAHRTGDSPVAGTETATTIRTAVAAAGQASRLMTLFAETAQRTVSAADVLVLQLTETQLLDDPIARATDGQQPSLSLERLGELAEFSMQAELRAGVTITELDPNGELDAAHAISHDVAVPVLIDDEAWGVIVASRRADEHPFDDHDLSILRHIASEMASAASSTSHWAEIERMALRDQLTGLANRHELYRVLDEIFDRPPLERLDTALIMCDVDGLKVVNDTLGHQAGDRLLKDAAAALRGAIRDVERTTVCRIGGDEFCMVIDGGALLTAHEISDMIERLFARSAGSGPVRSISCGIAFANEEIESRSALLRAADENQYQTKRARKASIERELAALEASGSQPVDRRAIRE